MNDIVGITWPVLLFFRTGVQYPAVSAGFSQFVPPLLRSVAFASLGFAIDRKLLLPKNWCRCAVPAGSLWWTMGSTSAEPVVSLHLILALASEVGAEVTDVTRASPRPPTRTATSAITPIVRFLRWRPTWWVAVSGMVLLLTGMDGPAARPDSRRSDAPGGDPAACATVAGACGHGEITAFMGREAFSPVCLL